MLNYIWWMIHLCVIMNNEQEENTENLSNELEQGSNSEKT
jgi:hypothetical protein